MIYWYDASPCQQAFEFHCSIGHRFLQTLFRMEEVKVNSIILFKRQNSLRIGNTFPILNRSDRNKIDFVTFLRVCLIRWPKYWNEFWLKKKNLLPPLRVIKNEKKINHMEADVGIVGRFLLLIDSYEVGKRNKLSGWIHLYC